jgi:hypothetical protein
MCLGELTRARAHGLVFIYRALDVPGFKESGDESECFSLALRVVDRGRVHRLRFRVDVRMVTRNRKREMRPW